MDSQEPRSLADFLAVLRRRRGRLMAVTLILLSITVALAMGLASVYRSTATILIEQQEIPEELVRSTVTSIADQRIQVLRQRVMTNSNLLKIIRDYDLYPEERRRKPMEVVLEKMRDDIALEMVSADVVDRRTGRPTQVTIAFTVSYDSASPTLAQKVTNDLTSLYLNENLKSRTERASETSTFLAEESERLKTRIGELESQLATFKEQNVARMPELVKINLDLMERNERQLVEVDRALRSARERSILLESQLTQLDPNSNLYTEKGERILSPADRLKILETEYLSKSAVYSPEHPDLRRLRKEIEGLRPEVGDVDARAGILIRLDDQRQALAGARKRYSEDHPDVKRLQRSVARLEQELAAAPVTPAAAQPVAGQENPAYVETRVRLQAARAELASLKKQRAELKTKIADFEQRLADSPGVEKEYRALARDYENALGKYREIRSKQMEAELAEALETERKGERFTLIEPPLLPQEPVRPNRIAILLVGFLFSAAGGLGAALFSEQLDRAVWDRDTLARLTGEPPLAVIPVIHTGQDLASGRRRRWLVALGVLVTVGVGLGIFHWLVTPLDVLWFSVLRRVGL